VIRCKGRPRPAPAVWRWLAEPREIGQFGERSSILLMGASMARLVVMYGTPKDPGAFDKYYFENHVPIAKQVPGLRKYEVSRGTVASPDGSTRFHLIATLHFDDVRAIQLAFASPQGQAAAADVATFATGGVDMIFFDSAEI
jgi:uncharacterized protein (TIGR02118 family)